MPLAFPNETRSYDESRHSVRFSGYDGMFEIPFVVGADALAKLGLTEMTEEHCLSTFDRARESIHGVARQAYSSARKKVYVLTAADFPQ